MGERETLDLGVSSTTTLTRLKGLLSLAFKVAALTRLKERPLTRLKGLLLPA